MSDKNDFSAPTDLNVNAKMATEPCASQIWSDIQESMSPILNGPILTNEQCDVTFSDTAQQKPRDPLGEITVTFSGSSNLAEIQKQYNGSR
jgi:hypothetical protein